jgi:hypothetical protein
MEGCDGVGSGKKTNGGVVGEANGLRCCGGKTLQTQGEVLKIFVAFAGECGIV